MSEFIEYNDETPPHSRRNLHQQQQQNDDVRASYLTSTSGGAGGGGGGLRDSKIVYSDALSDNINAMRYRQSLLDGLRGSGMGGIGDIGAPEPTIMFKPGSADENASGFTKAFKRLASSWKKRKVSVTAKGFFYDDIDTGKTIGALKLEEITQVKNINRQVMKERGCPENLRDFGWFLVGSGRQYVFACQDARTRDTWVGFLLALVRQRQNEEQYLGDDGAYTNTEGRSISFGNGNTPGAGGRTKVVSTPGRNRDSIPPQIQSSGNYNDEYDPSPETLQANEAVFDSVRNFKTRQYLSRGSDVGSQNDDNDRDQQHARENLEDDYDDEEQESAASGDSEMQVEIGNQVIPATIEKTKEKQQAIIQVPGPNTAYRRENVVIEALFDDLRTQEPDHVRLSRLEAPDSSLTYFRSHLLRTAQENDLPSDRMPQPLLVADCYDGADQIWPPLRNDSLLPASRIKKLQVQLDKMDLMQKTPAFQGMNCIVVDADGFVVGGSSRLSDNSSKGNTSLLDFAREIQVRHAAWRIFQATGDQLVGVGTKRSNTENQLLPAATHQNNNNNRSFDRNPTLTTPKTLNHTAGKSSIRQHASKAMMAFPESPSPQQNQAQFPSAVPVVNNNKNNNNSITANNNTFASSRPPQSPTKPNNANRDSEDNDSFDNIEETKSLKNAEINSSTGVTQQRTLAARLFTQSVAVLRNFGQSNLDSTTGRGGAGASKEQLQALMNSSQSVINQYLPAGARQMLYGRDGQSPCPSAHGPVIVIETTKRKVTITDAAYRSDILNDRGALKRSPLYMITTEDLVAGSTK